MSQDISKDSSPSFSKSKTVTVVRTVSVAVTTGQLMKSNPARVAAQFSNLSASHVYISPSRDVSSTLGIRLQASEGWYGLLASEDGALVEQEWFVIGAGAVNILVIEVLRR